MSDSCQTFETRFNSGNKKIALVTGSASGIGANIARDLAAKGYFVIVTGRDDTAIQRVVQECNRISAAALGDHLEYNDCTSAIAFKADLYHFEQIDRLIEFIHKKFRRLDILVNNACWRGDHADLLKSDQSYDDFKRVMHMNVSVPMYLVHKCLIPLRQSYLKSLTTSGKAKSDADKSIIVNISSIASQIVVPLHSYSISKACLSELSRQLSDELTQRLGILSATVSPGPVLTDERPHHQAMSKLTLMNRVGTTQEISNLVLFVLSNAEMFNGKELNIDGGYMSKQKVVPSS